MEFQTGEYRRAPWRTTSSENTPFEVDSAARGDKRSQTVHSVDVHRQLIILNQIQYPRCGSRCPDVAPSQFEIRRTSRTTPSGTPYWFRKVVQAADPLATLDRSIPMEQEPAARKQGANRE